MDAFSASTFEEGEVDPAAEFLAREQSQLAGLEDDLTTVVPPVKIETAINGNATDAELTKVAAAPLKLERDEPEKIKKWRDEQRTRLEEKDAQEEKKKEEWRAQAKRELEEWYRHHNDLIQKTKEANRNAEKNFVADVAEIEPGTEWERISKLCEFNPKSNRSNRDTSRMRSIILQLKQTPTTKKTTN